MLLSTLILSERIRRRDVILRVFPANTRIGPVNGVRKRKGKRRKGKGKRVGEATSEANRL
jgi:hypothetical protein